MKSSYNYIHIDENKNIIVYVPLSSGNRFGLDNTCKHNEAFNRFLNGDSSSYSSVIDSLKSLKTDLSISFKKANSEEAKEDIKKMLAQIETYIKVINISRDKGILYIPREYGKLPDFFTTLASTEDKNLVSIKFSVRYPDIYLNAPVKDNNYFMNFGRFIQNVPNIPALGNINFTRDSLLNEFKNTELKWNKNNFEQIQGKIKDFLTENGAKPESIAAISGCNMEDIGSAMIWDEGDEIPENEIAETIINSLKEINLFETNDTLLGILQSHDIKNSSDKEKIWISFQMFVACIEMCYYEQNQIKLGVGEKNTLELLKTTFLNSIATGKNIEDSLIDACKPKITDDLKRKIKTKFNEAWNTLKESPHFDEFVFLLEKEGSFKSHQNHIVVPFAKVLEVENPDLYNQYFANTVKINNSESLKSVTNSNASQNNINADALLNSFTYQCFQKRFKNKTKGDFENLTFDQKKALYQKQDLEELKIFLEKLTFDEQNALREKVGNDVNMSQTMNMGNLETAIYYTIDGILSNKAASKNTNSAQTPQNQINSAQTPQNQITFQVTISDQTLITELSKHLQLEYFSKKMFDDAANTSKMINDKLDAANMDKEIDGKNMGKEIDKKLESRLLDRILMANSESEKKIQEIKASLGNKNTISDSRIRNLVYLNDAISNTSNLGSLQNFTIGDPLITKLYPSVKNNLKYENYLPFLQHECGAIKVFEDFESKLHADVITLQKSIDNLPNGAIDNLENDTIYIMNLKQLHDKIISIQNTYLDPNTKSLYYIDDAGAILIKEAIKILEQINTNSNNKTPELLEIRERCTAFLANTIFFATHEMYQNTEQNIKQNIEVPKCDKLANVTGLPLNSKVDIPHKICNTFIKQNSILRDYSRYRALLIAENRTRDYSAPKNVNSRNGDVLKYNEFSSDLDLTEYVKKEYFKVKSEINKLPLGEGGTTANIVASNGKDLSILNLGDTRSILLIGLKDGSFVSIDLTDIHTPLHYRKADITKLSYEDGGQLRFTETQTNTCGIEAGWKHEIKPDIHFINQDTLNQIINDCGIKPDQIENKYILSASDGVLLKTDYKLNWKRSQVQEDKSFEALSPDGLVKTNYTFRKGENIISLSEEAKNFHAATKDSPVGNLLFNFPELLCRISEENDDKTVGMMKLGNSRSLSIFDTHGKDKVIDTVTSALEVKNQTILNQVQSKPTIPASVNVLNIKSGPAVKKLISPKIQQLETLNTQNNSIKNSLWQFFGKK